MKGGVLSSHGVQMVPWHRRVWVVSSSASKAPWFNVAHGTTPLRNAYGLEYIQKIIYHYSTVSNMLLCVKTFCHIYPNSAHLLHGTVWGHEFYPS